MQLEVYYAVQKVHQLLPSHVAIHVRDNPHLPHPQNPPHADGPEDQHHHHLARSLKPPELDEQRHFLVANWRQDLTAVVIIAFTLNADHRCTYEDRLVRSC